VRDDRPYLEYIQESIEYVQESIERIESYLDPAEAPIGRREMLNDPRTEDAVLRRLETLSDAAGHLSDGLKLRHPEIPWREVTNFRNVLAHGYVDVNEERVWTIISTRLAPLKLVVEQELREQGASW
jgi:uncharacterized protein with HEPN domain